MCSSFRGNWGQDSRRADGPREEGEATEPDQSPTPIRGDAREAAQRRADAVGLLAERALAAGFRDSAPVSGSRAERYQVPPLPELPAHPVEALVRGNHGRGVMPGAYGLTKRWRWDRDVPWAIASGAECGVASATLVTRYGTHVVRSLAGRRCFASGMLAGSPTLMVAMMRSPSGKPTAASALGSSMIAPDLM